MNMTKKGNNHLLALDMLDKVISDQLQNEGGGERLETGKWWGGNAIKYRQQRQSDVYL